MWKGNYSNVFNSVTNTCDKAEVEEYISSEVDVQSINVRVSVIVEAIKYVPHYKSPGHDYLMSEHFQLAFHRLPVLLAVVFIDAAAWLSARQFHANYASSYFEKQNWWYNQRR